MPRGAVLARTPLQVAHPTGPGAEVSPDPAVDVAGTAHRAAVALGAAGARGVRVLARRADANVVVALTTVPGGRRVVAKVRTGAQGSDGTRAAAALRALASVATPDGPLAVPAVLHHDPARALLVTEHVPGTALDRALAAADLPALRRAGAALAALHALPVVLGPTVGLRECLTDLVRPQPDALALTVPELAARVSDVLDGVLAAEPVGAVRVPVHRDVHLRQLHDDAGRTWLLDWDLAAQGDAALDVGNLVASLRSKAADPRAVDAVLDGYATGDRTRALDRAPVHEAFTYLRLALKRWRLGGPAALGQVGDLLAAAEHVLDGHPRPSLHREVGRA